MKVSKKDNQILFNKILEYAKEMSKIQSLLLTYLDEEEEAQQNYIYLTQAITESKIQESKYKMKGFYHLLLSIFNNHKRATDFLNKMDKIINQYKSDLFKHFTRNELFCLFSKNKRFAIPLFSDVTTDGHLDTEILKQLHFTNDDNYDQVDFENDIKKGENEHTVCELIRNDDVDHFVTYIEKTNLSRLTCIYSTQYESHLYLMKNRPSLIEYASFFGSNEIFTYLQLNQVKLNTSLWLTVIHGRNNDLIHKLEELKVPPPNDDYQSCIDEAILCHHNEYIEYIQMNLLDESKSKPHSSLVSSLKGYNFEILKNEIESDDVEINVDAFIALIANDHPYILQLLIENQLIDINQVLYTKDNDHTEVTPLYIAVNEGSYEILELLLQQKEINLKPKLISKKFFFVNDVFFFNIIYNKFSLLHIAAQNNDIEVMKLLLEKGVIDVNYQTIQKKKF